MPRSPAEPCLAVMGWTHGGRSLVSYHLSGLREAWVVTSAAGGRANQCRLSGPDPGKLALVIGGLGGQRRPAQLFLSRRAVEFHPSNAYQKLGVRSRGDLVRLALN